MSDKFICIVDESKLSKGLGPSFPLPVEITPFCHEHTRRVLEGLPSVRGCRGALESIDKKKYILVPLHGVITSFVLSIRSCSTDGFSSKQQK
jgi:ribose 5-phosphate isomerase